VSGIIRGRATWRRGCSAEHTGHRDLQPINVLAGADMMHPHRYHLVFDLVNNSIVSDAYSLQVIA
jgi:hypothetical protein